MTRELASLEPVLIGYLYKEIAKKPRWLAAKIVEEVASVSECISPAFENRIASWKHNGCWLYDSPDIAAEFAAHEKRGWRLFAYKTYPWIFTQFGEQELSIPAINPTPLNDQLKLRGFDVVGWSEGGFECSPLSCNGLASEYDVNRQCLFDKLEEALAVAQRIRDLKCEPGNYVIVEVWEENSITA